MILTHVKFALAKPMALDEAKAIFERTAPKYKGREGLLRKTYLLSEDGLTAGAVYLWKDRASAERCYTDDWRKMVTEVSFYHAPITVENAPA
jgi:hypothetical protein